MIYRITLVSTKDGTGTFALIDVASQAGTYRSAGCTRTFRCFPASVRAIEEAKGKAYRHAKARGAAKHEVLFERA